MFDVSIDVVFGTDFEMAVVPLNQKEDSHTVLVPPIWLTEVLGAEILGYTDPPKNFHAVIFETSQGIPVYSDGALLEAATEPTSNPAYLYKQVHQTLQETSAFLEETFGLTAVLRPASRFDTEKYLYGEETSEKIRDACIAGCSPDLDAIDPDYVSEVRDLTEWDWRGIGAHLHMSFKYPEVWTLDLHQHAETVVKLLALTVGNLTIAEHTQPELEKIRREVFGSAGRYRTPEYACLWGETLRGLEFRPLSVDWLSSLELTTKVLETANMSIQLLDNFLTEEEKIESLFDRFLDNTIKAIAEVNPKLAKRNWRQLTEVLLYENFVPEIEEIF